MQFVLWFEPERAGPGSWLAENHPEWILGGKNGGLVNLGNRDAWKWIVDRIDSLIKSEGVDVYRQDFNIDPLGYWRGADAQDRQGITENRARHADTWPTGTNCCAVIPKLWIDSCASGGRRNDLETLRRAVPLLRSDCFVDPTPASRRSTVPDVRALALGSVLRLGHDPSDGVLVPQQHLPGVARRLGHAKERSRLRRCSAG